MYDVAVIGAGVIGGMVARNLARYNLKTVIVESETDVANGSSRANSGIVHAGFDALVGSLKAKFNVAGSNMMEDCCRELGVKYIRNGALVVTDEEEGLKGLTQLLERGEQNGVKGLKILNAEEVKEIEPNLQDSIKGALYAQTSAIVCPYELTLASVGNAMDNGVEFVRDFKVVEVKDNTLISQDGQEITAKYFINCAGANSQAVSNLFGDYSFSQGYRKGEYMLLDNSSKDFVKTTVFSLPTKAGKGVLVSPTVDGNVLVGPTSVEEEFFDNSIRLSGFDEIKEKASLMCKNIPYYNVITSFAGVRNYCDRHDFVIEESKVSDKLFNVCGIESPGLTSAPAIGEYVADIVAKKFNAQKNKDFNPYRRAYHYFKELSIEEKNAIIKERPEYGKIICRCEEVTLGEIIDAMKMNPKAVTIDGIKLRTRAGMGRCQSGFCQPNTLKIIMQEYGLKFDEVLKKNKGSNVIVGGEK